jgi:uncharacterized protein (DUF1778 family)
MPSDRPGRASRPGAASAGDPGRPQNGREPAEQTLLDQRAFLVSGDQYQELLDLLDGSAQDNPGLSDLFSRPEPWEPR